MFDDPQTQSVKHTADLVKLINENIIGRRVLGMIVNADGTSFQFDNGAVLHLMGTIQGLRVEFSQAVEDGGSGTVQ